MAGPDYSGITKGITGQYDALRQKAAQQESANLQGQRDALQRRAAQLQGGPSGAFIKQEQLAGDASAQRLQQANEGIDQQQSADLRNVNMTQLGQQFQTSEREAGQGFQAGQMKSQQDFSHGERLGSQDFAAQQALSGQKFTHGENQAQLAQQGQLATGTYNGQKTTAQQQLDQAGKQFDWTKGQQEWENQQNLGIQALNAITSLKAANWTGDQVKALVTAALPGFDFSKLGDLSGVTKSAPGESDYRGGPATAIQAVNPAGARGVDQWQGRPDRYTNPNSPFYNP